MTSRIVRMLVLTVSSGGFVLVSGCAITEAVVNTILAAFNIVDIWV